MGGVDSSNKIWMRSTHLNAFLAAEICTQTLNGDVNLKIIERKPFVFKKKKSVYNNNNKLYCVCV